MRLVYLAVLLFSLATLSLCPAYGRGKDHAVPPQQTDATSQNKSDAPAPTDVCEWFSTPCKEGEAESDLANKMGLLLCGDRAPVKMLLELRYEVPILENVTRLVQKTEYGWCVTVPACEIYSNIIISIFGTFPDGTKLRVGSLAGPQYSGEIGTFIHGRAAPLVFVRRGERPVVSVNLGPKTPD